MSFVIYLLITSLWTATAWTKKKKDNLIIDDFPYSNNFECNSKRRKLYLLLFNLSTVSLVPFLSGCLGHCSLCNESVVVDGEWQVAWTFCNRFALARKYSHQGRLKPFTFRVVVFCRVFIVWYAYINLVPWRRLSESILQIVTRDCGKYFYLPDVRCGDVLFLHFIENRYLGKFFVLPKAPEIKTLNAFEYLISLFSNI